MSVIVCWYGQKSERLMKDPTSYKTNLKMSRDRKEITIIKTKSQMSNFKSQSTKSLIEN